MNAGNGIRSLQEHLLTQPLSCPFCPNTFVLFGCVTVAVATKTETPEMWRAWDGAGQSLIRLALAPQMTDRSLPTSVLELTGCD